MLVALENVTKSFGAVQALKGVSFSVEASEIVALLGPNGAGKTTAIAIMLGLRRPTTGRTSLFGMDPRDERARSACGVMLQESGVPGFLRVREILNLFRSYYPTSKPTEELLALGGFATRQIRSSMHYRADKSSACILPSLWPVIRSCCF